MSHERPIAFPKRALIPERRADHILPKRERARASGVSGVVAFDPMIRSIPHGTEFVVGEMLVKEFLHRHVFLQFREFLAETGVDGRREVVSRRLSVENMPPLGRIGQRPTELGDKFACDRCFAVHEFPTTLRVVSKFRCPERIDAPAEPVACLEYEDTGARPREFSRRHEPCGSSTDHYDVPVPRSHALSYELLDGHPARPTLALYPEALFHLTSEVFSVERPVETKHDEHRDDAAHERIRYILCGVENVTLMREEKRASCRVDRHERPPFDDFVERREREDDVEWNVVCPKAASLRHADEHFANRVRHEKSEREVQKPVIHVAVRAEPFPEPEAKGDLAVRPVRADNVHDKKERDERVRCVGELEVARADEKHRHKKKNKEIFEKPRVPMERLPCRPEPH